MHGQVVVVRVGWGKMQLQVAGGRQWELGARGTQATPTRQGGQGKVMGWGQGVSKYRHHHHQHNVLQQVQVRHLHTQ